MNTELNKLFGRDFIIGFVLPALIFLFTTSMSFLYVGHPIEWLKLKPEDPFKESAFLAMVAFALGVLLQAINRELFRLLEGYWPAKLRGPLCKCQKKRFQELEDEVRELKMQREHHKGQYPKIAFPKREELRKLS